MLLHSVFITYLPPTFHNHQSQNIQQGKFDVTPKTKVKIFIYILCVYEKRKECKRQPSQSKEESITNTQATMVNSYSKQYKPWRKGKGGTGGSKDKYPLNEKVVGSVMNKGRSLKNQVRSKEKFLSRLTRKQSENESQNDKGMIEKTKQLIETVKIEIEKLKHQIKEKEDIEREKKIAIK